MDIGNLWGYEVGYQTTVGSFGEFPRDIGNCFSLHAKHADGEGEWNIVNFKIENLNELVSDRVLSWPIRLRALSYDIAVICDERIPEDWYSSDYCDCCCPRDLLPGPQRDRQLRQIMRGDRQEDGDIVTGYVGGRGPGGTQFKSRVE